MVALERERWQEMSLQVKALARSASPFTPVAAGLLQRKCACGQHTAAGGECEECHQKRMGMMQRAAVNSAPANSAPPIVHEVINSPGRPLDIGTRAFMEPRFGHDFSQVRVHSAVPKVIQTKLSVNRPGDKYQPQADQVAD